MALDLEAYHKDIEDERRQDEERAAQEANQAAWEAKPFYSKAATIISEDVGAIADAAGDRLGKIRDAYSAYHDAQVASRDKYGIYIPTPEVQEAGDNLRGVVLEPVTHPIKSFVGGYINQKADEGSTIAQDVRQSETFVHYFMTPEDKLKKAKEIEDTTGISADAFINDDVAYKQALNVYDYKRAKAAVMPEDQAMEAVWQEFPELRNVSLTNPNDAALALHDMDSVRQTHGIVETFNHFIALGNKELEYNNLQYKIMTNRADDNDRERAADLERMIAEDKKTAPSFFDDPLSAIVGGMASSGPEMLQSIREGVRDGLITAEAAAIVGAALGTGVEPLGGTLVGGAAGAGAGFITGFVRSVFGSVARRQAMRTAITRGMQFGAFEGMRRPETGSRYAEYGNMKDTDGNPLLTDNDRRLYATLGGAANAGIEMANFGIATKPLSRGAVNFLTKGGTDKYAVDAIKGVVDVAKYDVAKRESVAAFAKAQVKDTLKIAATESAEEGAQSIADDLIHNRIVDASDGRAADKAYSIGDIAANALVASVEAIPAGLGFGMASSLGGGSLGSVRHAQRLFSEKAKEELAAQKTMTGTVMLNRLQQVASSAKLKETAPDVQQKIIRTQVQGSGFENAYIDTAMAVKKENGLADLKEVAKTAGIREEELEKTIQSGGHLFVPAEKYAQSAASPQLLESVSFSPETDSLARMKENAKMLSDALETAQKRAVHARADIVKSIADEYFPEARENLDEQEKARLYGERDMAKAVIAQNTESPAEGWRSLYNDFTAARDEILQPAMDALSKGMKQGVDILPLGEDGRGIRVSNNAPWYQEYYKQHGKAPNQAQLRDLAYLLTVGDASAPNVEGWIPTTREAAEAMDAARGELDELNGHIQTLENIKERMMKVDSFEVKGSAGLSPEGYKLYRQIIEMLEKIGGEQKEDKQTKVARMNAMLFAHHADIFAAAMRTQEGKEEYTALNYFRDRFALRYGGTDMRSNEDVLHQAVRAGLNLDEQVQVVGFDTLANDLKGKSDKEIIAYISKLSRTEPIPVADFKALVGLPKDNDRYGQRHLIRGKANQSAANRAARNTVLSNFRDVVQHAVVVEVVPNTKKKSLHGLQGAKWRTQKRKNEVENYYRLMVPVRINGRIRTLVIVAEEHNGVVSSPTSVKVYEIYYAKKHPLATAPITETSSKAGAKAGVSVAEEDALSTISIRDMLTGVKDADGNLYAQSATNVPSSEKEAVRKQYEGTEQWMKAPNGKPTNLTEDQWVAVRTPAFKAWFGDWEQAARLMLPRHAENLEEAAAAARSIAGKRLTNDLLGVDAFLSNKNIGKMVSASATRKSVDARVHALAVANVDRLFSRAITEYTHKDRDNDKNIKQIHRMFSPFVVGDNVFVAKLTVKELVQEKEGNRLYSVEALEIKEASRKWNAAYNATEGVLTSFPQEAFDNIIARFLPDGKNCSKIVDENGEPMVVYHGSDAEFEVFDRTKGRSGMDIQGMFFSPWDYESEGYGKNVRAFFLNIKNPATGSKSYEVFSKYKSENYAGIKARDELEHSGYDGVASGNMEDEDLEFIAFEPNQIKSATDNNGAFSPDDANIYHQKDSLEKNVGESTHAIPLDDGQGKVVDIQFVDVDEKRALQSPHIGIRFSDEEYKIGDDVENSHNWVDGDWTDEELDGTSTVNVAEPWSYDSLDELKETAIKRLNKAGRYPYDYAYLVAGTSSDYGEDTNESIIRNAEVVGILKLVRESEAESFNQMLRQEVKGEISKEDGKRIITLFERADESTFMHEMGHMFLMDLDELAKMDEASAKELETVNAWAEWHEGAADEYAETDFADEFRDHENAILAAKKSGDVVAEKAALERWRQERFARGFEMYLSEGKAPSAAMRSVFRRFKAFLRKIYNLAKNAGAMPSVEVQAVMARMIATENEIAEAKLDERFRPIEKLLGKESVESLLGETEAELYKRWTQEAQEEAEDILRKRVMNDLKKEAREELNQKVEAERERKRAELENDPVYLAEYAMRQGGSTDVVMNWFPSYAAYKKARGKRKTLENELKDYITEYARKLDEQIMQAHLSDENVARAMQTPKAYHRRLAIESAALRRKERLMRLLGGNAPEEVKKKAVAEAKKAESPTRRGTKQEVRKEYERSAYEHERFMREEARAYLREREISESCNPRFFRRNERKYARAMDKAAAAGKWSEVLALKEQQAFAAACAYEAEKNEKRLNQLLANVKRKLSARTVRLAADERYWLNHIGYLLGLKANDEEKPVKCAKLSELFEQYKDNNDIDACDPSDLLDVITEGKKRYQEMQLDDFADIVNALGILYNAGRRRNEMLTKSMQGKTTDDILGEIFTDDTALKPSGIVEHPVSDDIGGMGYSELVARIPLLGEVVAKAAQEGNIQLTKPELILRLMGDKAHRYIYGTYDRAQMKESELLEEKRAALEKIFSVYSRREKMKWKDRNIDAHGDMISKENVLCLAMNWGTETNRKRVMDDIGQRFDVMRTLKENMTEKDWKVVQEVWNLLDTFWEESARTEERLNGARVGKVPASAFTIETADGKEITLRGGYYPLRYNPKKASKVNDKQTEEDVKGRMTGAQVFGTKRSHVKERSEGDVIAPVLLRFDVLKDHIFNASHNIAFRIAARDVYRIINDKKFEAYVSSTYGRPIYDYLKQWAVDVWAVPVEASDSAASGINRIIGGLRRNSTMAIMGWRLWPCLENVMTNTFLNMDKIGVRKTAKAYLEGLPIFGRGPKALRDMAKKSAFMADRISNMERDIRRDPHIFDPTYAPLEFLRDNAYFGISFTDQLFSVPLWNKVYQEAFPKALAQINEENEANKRTYQEAQNRVHELRAEIYDLRREMEEKVDPLLQEIIREKNKERIREMKKHVREKKERIRAKEKEFAEAGIALERAGELPIYDEAERIREAEMRAVQAGDAAVRDTFGSGQTKDISGAQRTRSELFKLFTSFFSFFNTQYNAALEAHYRGKYSKTGYKHIHVWMPLARTILFRIVLVGILGGLGKAALGLDGGDDKDKYRKVQDPKTGEITKVEIPWEERWMNTVMKNTLSTATGMFPGIRDLAGLALDRIFDGTTYGRTFEFGSVASRGFDQAQATWNLIMKKGEDDLKREEEEAKERERVKKMTRKQREKYEEEKKYKKPKKEVGYVDIAKSAAQTVSTFTASRHGITNTPSDGLFSIAQFAVDMMETDNYYDPDIRNVLRAVIFDKKLREKEVPKKPEPPKKKQRRTRGRKERTND